LGGEFVIYLMIAQYSQQTRKFIDTSQCCNNWVGLADSTTSTQRRGAVVARCCRYAIDSGHELSGSKISVHGITNTSNIQSGERKTMPSFDVVSEVDLHEIRNAVDQAIRELRNRFDFRGVDANIELEEQSILLSAPEEFQLGQIKDILRDKMTARNVDSRALTPGSIEGAGKLKRQSFALAQGIDKDSARQITKILKESKLKIQSQINGDKVRVTGKKRDDLQAAMAALKESDIAMPLQYNNFRD
jgi:uncharacterized protein YajQ (UPF0234 family)